MLFSTLVIDSSELSGFDIGTTEKDQPFNYYSGTYLRLYQVSYVATEAMSKLVMVPYTVFLAMFIGVSMVWSSCHSTC
jgi:hypothetical protein